VLGSLAVANRRLLFNGFQLSLELVGDGSHFQCCDNRSARAQLLTPAQYRS
jgi:hypothetical protein